jgi:hypothetical protein
MLEVKDTLPQRRWSAAVQYAFEQAWEDYRLCAPQSAYVPALWCNDRDRVMRDRMHWLWLTQIVPSHDGRGRRALCGVVVRC